MLQCSLHNHTFRCKHAVGDAEDLAQAAFAGGCRVIGISDHTPLPGRLWPSVRMEMNELDDYCAAIDRAGEQHPDMMVLKGMECEWGPEFKAFYQEELLGARAFDYLIGAGHFYRLQGEWRNAFVDMDNPQDLKAYAHWLEEMMSKKLFHFIAHPDLFGCGYEVWDEDLEACSRDILAAAAGTGTPLEINANGMRKYWRAPGDLRSYPYPWEPFWELAAEYAVEVVINADAHHPNELFSDQEACLQLAGKYRLNEWDPRKSFSKLQSLR